MVEKLIRFWWYIRGRCRFCGGEVWSWDDRRCYCRDCDAKQ